MTRDTLPWGIKEKGLSSLSLSLSKISMLHALTRTTGRRSGNGMASHVMPPMTLGTSVFRQR